MFAYKAKIVPSCDYVTPCMTIFFKKDIMPCTKNSWYKVK